jgi:hypothetical protein
LFSFVLSFDCGGIIHHRAIKNDSSAIPQPTERQNIGNQIDAAFIFARAHFVNVKGRAECSFFDSDRAPVLSVRPVDVILVKEHVVELALINHLSASAFVEVPLLRFA